MGADGVWEPCYHCKEPMWMKTDQAAMLRRSGQTFYCIWGHPQVYTKGPTEADELRRERDRLKQQAARLEDEKRIAWNTANAQADRAAAAERRASAARGQVTKLKKRAAAGVCPCCNRQFTDLQRHMASKHAGFVAEEVQAEAGMTIQ